MPTITFSRNILTHVDLDISSVEGATVRESLEEVFSSAPRLKTYLFEDDGTLRKHIAVVVNGEPVHDRSRLTDPVKPDDDIFVMQALSGG